MKDDDTKLIWEAYDDRLDNPHHQREVKKLERENPQLDYTRAKEKRKMGIPLTNDDKAVLDKYESPKVGYPRPVEEESELTENISEQRYVVADSEGVYGVYSTMDRASIARDDIGGGSYIVASPVDADPQQYDSL